MSGPGRDGGADAAPVRDTGRRLVLTFEAFHDTHYREWLRFAHLQVGNRADAAQVVDGACAHLVAHWPHVLKQESVAAYAWAVLKEHLNAWLTALRRPAAFVETASFAAAVSRMLEHPRERFAALESGLGLYAAISRLPERQYDAVVLRYVLGCGDEQVARLLGVRESTVRSLVRYARRRLSAELGITGNPVAGD